MFHSDVLIYVFQHLVELVNHAIHRGTLEGAISCSVLRRLMDYVAMYFSFSFITYLDLIRPSSLTLYT
jgi:hypothetical protein